MFPDTLKYNELMFGISRDTGYIDRLLGPQRVRARLGDRDYPEIPSGLSALDEWRESYEREKEEGERREHDAFMGRVMKEAREEEMRRIWELHGFVKKPERKVLTFPLLPMPSDRD